MAATHREVRSEVRRFGVIAGAVALAAAFAMSPSPARDVATILGLVISVFVAIADVVTLGYQTAPALTLGITLALAFPLIAILMCAWDRSIRSREATRYYRSGILRAAAEVADNGDAEGLPGPAFLEVAGQSGMQRYPILRNMVRIGREDDNDIRIPNNAVDRYHAAISREDFDAWRITDLSGLDGNRLIVNGRRCTEALLKDGDVIQFGPGRMRFRTGLALSSETVQQA
ncbi:MAG: FHA domain-containing protein [Hyphomicrobium sp.]